MLFKNLNKPLDSETLNRAGFNFDGYYYINPACPIKLNAETNGFTANFIDESAPQLNHTISTYQELISMMVRTLQFTIESSLANRQFTNPKDQIKAMTDVVKRYLEFDPDIKLALVATSMGMQMNPNNEYTYTLINGDIRNFKVYYEVMHPNTIDESESLESGKIELEIAAQCISWPFLMRLLPTEIEGFTEGDKLNIVKVRLIVDDKEIPFFGMGIPTVHEKENTEEI